MEVACIRLDDKLRRNMLPPFKVWDWFLNIWWFVKTFFMIVPKNTAHTEMTVLWITVKKLNGPYVQLQLLWEEFWGVVWATSATACQQPGSWKRKASDKGLSDLREDLYLCCLIIVLRKVRLVSLSITFCHCDGKLAWSWLNVGFLLELRGLSHKIGHHFPTAIFLFKLLL